MKIRAVTYHKSSIAWLMNLIFCCGLISCSHFGTGDDHASIDEKTFLVELKDGRVEQLFPLPEISNSFLMLHYNEYSAMVIIGGEGYVYDIESDELMQVELPRIQEEYDWTYIDPEWLVHITYEKNGVKGRPGMDSLLVYRRERWDTTWSLDTTFTSSHNSNRITIYTDFSKLKNTINEWALQEYIYEAVGEQIVNYNIFYQTNRILQYENGRFVSKQLEVREPGIPYYFYKMVHGKDLDENYLGLDRDYRLLKFSPTGEIFNLGYATEKAFRRWDFNARYSVSLTDWGCRVGCQNVIKIIDIDSGEQSQTNVILPQSHGYLSFDGVHVDGNSFAHILMSDRGVSNTIWVQTLNIPEDKMTAKKYTINAAFNHLSPPVALGDRVLFIGDYE